MNLFADHIQDRHQKTYTCPNINYKPFRCNEKIATINKMSVEKVVGSKNSKHIEIRSGKLTLTNCWSRKSKNVSSTSTRLKKTIGATEEYTLLYQTQSSFVYRSI